MALTCFKHVFPDCPRTDDLEHPAIGRVTFHRPDGQVGQDPGGPAD